MSFHTNKDFLNISNTIGDQLPTTPSLAHSLVQKAIKYSEADPFPLILSYVTVVHLLKSLWLRFLARERNQLFWYFLLGSITSFTIIEGLCIYALFEGAHASPFLQSGKGLIFLCFHMILHGVP